MLAVLLIVQFLVVITLGATGYSDRMLEAVISEELRGIRPSLAETIRDPARLEEALTARREELYSLYGLDRPWYTRLPNMVFRVFTMAIKFSESCQPAGSACTDMIPSGSSRCLTVW